MATLTNGSLLSDSENIKPVTSIIEGSQNLSSSNYGEGKDEADADITADELNLLDEAGVENDEDNLNEKNVRLDSTDEDGDSLNEGSDLTGDDLDVPGADEDDEDEIIGEEDEENNSYSKSDQDDN